MQIRHENPKPELSHSVRAPLGLELKTGEKLTISEWSLEGFTYPENRDVLPKEAVLSIPFQGVDIRFDVTLARRGNDKFLSFEGLSGRQRETLSVFYRSLLSGKMASTGDVITSLDTPVDLVPMGETEEEQAQGMAGKAPRSLRAVASVCLYLCIAALAFWTLGSGVWNKLSQVNIQNARIEAELVPHTAAARGFVANVLVAPGETVERGDILVRLADPEGEAALSDVRGRIDLIESRLFEAQQALLRLDQRVDRLRAALVQDLLTGADAAVARLAAFDARITPNNRDLFVAQDTAQQQVDTLSDELRRLARERGRLRDAADALHVLAADDGIVREVLVLKSQLVGRGTEIVLLEGLHARTARGWLDHSMASAIFTGMAVKVEIAGAQGPQTLEGEVTHVKAAIDPEISPEFGMLVTVAFPTLSASESREALGHLTPVELRAERGWATAWDRTISSWGL